MAEVMALAAWEAEANAHLLSGPPFPDLQMMKFMILGAASDSHMI